MGIAVAEDLHHLDIKNTHIIICDTELAALKASSVAAKAFLPASAENEYIKNEWVTEVMCPFLESYTYVVVVADLNEPVSYHVAPIVLEVAKEKGCFSIGLIRRSTELGWQKRPADALTAVQYYAQSVVLFEQHLMDYEAQICQLADTVRALVEICLPVGQQTHPEDVKEVRKLMQPTGQIAVVIAAGTGDERATKAVNNVIAVLERQSFDIRLTERAMLVMISSAEHPLMLREQMAVVNALTDRISEELRVFKFGTVQDPWLGDKLQMNLLLWQPINHTSIATEISPDRNRC
jgi:cell division GTPase FtsZ